MIRPVLCEKCKKMEDNFMKQKMKIIHGAALAAKLISGVALYFSIAILITAVDRVIAAGKMGVGYLILILGCGFLAIQFLLTIRVIKELFSVDRVPTIPALLKGMVGLSFYLSLAILANFSQKIISPETATLGFALAFAGILLFAAQFSTVVYCLSNFLERNNREMQEE